MAARSDVREGVRRRGAGARGSLAFLAVVLALFAAGQLWLRRTPLFTRGDSPKQALGSLLDSSADAQESGEPPSTGAPRGIGCDGTREVVAQIHERFAAPVSPPEPARFAELVAGWLDPHGLWSAAADAPPAALIAADADALLAELSPQKAPSECAAAFRVARALGAWTRELRDVYDRAFATAPALRKRSAGLLGLETVFDDGVVLRPARELAELLGHHLGSVSHAFGHSLAPYAAVGRERYFPELAADEWQAIVLAAALRGYVAAIDPHGQWAPLDEEWSLYSGDPSLEAPNGLWGEMVRTALGARIVDRPEAPLELDDLVLAIDGVPLAGLSVEQTEQLARVAPDDAGAQLVRRAIVLRQGEEEPLEVELDERSDSAPSPAALAEAAAEDELAVRMIRYAAGHVAVVAVPEVDEELGEALGEVVQSLSLGEPPLGLLLDLRGNGGGSMDGATAALSLFLPGVPVFTLLRGTRVTEALMTPAAHPSQSFGGPLAALVDGGTASAAEMIAGALDRYGRAQIVGQPTFGKGCVQEYFPDVAGAGALRLTTRLFALPDGSPVQGRGIRPLLALDLPESPERESDLFGALGPVSGPDIRVPVAPGAAWPEAGGRLGPCEDPVVCASLRALGRPAGVASRRISKGKGRLRADSARY